MRWTGKGGVDSQDLPVGGGFGGGLWSNSQTVGTGTTSDTDGVPGRRFGERKLRGASWKRIGGDDNIRLNRGGLGVGIQPRDWGSWRLTLA